MTSPEAPNALSVPPGDGSSLALRLEGVSKDYFLYDSPWSRFTDAIGIAGRRVRGHRRVFHALRDITLDIGTGERVGVVGRNGAGKSTLLKLISGNFKPTSGTIARNGKVLALMQAGLGFHPEFSGMQNIEASLMYNGLVGEELAAATEEIVEFVELGDYLYQPLKTYSMGMAARLQFAAATSIHPEILIIDELLSAGDAYFAAKCAERVKRITESGCTLLLVSHASQQIIQFCERAIWIEGGRIIMDAPAAQVVGAYEVECQERLKRSTEEAAASKLDAAKTGAASRFASKKWVAEKVVEKERPPEASLESEIRTSLSDGRLVYRWPSATGVKVDRFRILVDGKESEVAVTGGNLELHLDLNMEVDGPLMCRYYCSIFTIEGKRAAWLTSPLDEFDSVAGGSRQVVANLSPVLLGAGDYVLSISIFDGTNPLHINQATRYDLLARCADLKIVETDGRDPAIFHYPCAWSQTNQPNEVRD